MDMLGHGYDTGRGWGKHINQLTIVLPIHILKYTIHVYLYVPVCMYGMCIMKRSSSLCTVQVDLYMYVYSEEILCTPE
jgi:hypothetical protein